MIRIEEGKAVALGLLALSLFCGATRAEILTQANVLVAGTETYNVYRIPAFAVANDGALLLFAEGRSSQSDPGGPGDIDLVYKRSTDGGQSWFPLEVLHVENQFDYSDPRIVVDRHTGLSHLLYTQWPTDCGQTCVPGGMGAESSVIYYQTSADHGATWSGPVNINTQVKNPAWASLNTGPGIGIQLQWQDSAPERNGRLLIPGHQRPISYRGVALYSDNGGTTWTHGTGVTPHFSDESEVIELTNGDLLWDARRGSAGRNRSISRDGGDTWVDVHNGDIPISAVDGALVRYSARRAGGDRDRILFSGPLGNPPGTGNARSNIGIWTSYDEGKTFINPIQIQSGSAAYSALDRLQDGSIGLMYEVDHQTIRYVNFDLAELEKASHPASMSHYDGFANKVDAFRGGVGWSGPWENEGVSITPGALEFAGFLTTDDGQHAQLRGGDMKRNLGNGTIDLNASGDHYFSMFVKRGGSDNPSQQQKFLDILLQDSTGTTQAAFGVGSSENFFINDIGSTLSSDSGALAIDTTYLLLAKLSTQDDGQGNNFDQLSLAWYDDPLAIPTEEAEVEWRLVSDMTENAGGTISQITIRTGSDTDWRVDGLRIGSAFDAVILDTGIGPPQVLGDLNNDLLVDLADWVEFKNNFRLNTSTMGEDMRLRKGDFDQSGQVGPEDLHAFKTLFDIVNGPGALSAALTQVPEPRSILLLGGIGVAVRLLPILGKRQRRLPSPIVPRSTR